MKRITFSIETLLGRQREVSGYEVIPGIAIHGSAGCWQVSHSVSGLLLQSSRDVFKTREEAIVYAGNLIRVFPSVDWLAKADVLDKEVRKAVDIHYAGYYKPGGVYNCIQKMITGEKREQLSKKKAGRKKKPARRRA